MRPRFFGPGLACLGILALAADDAGDQQKAIDAIRKAGGTVQVDADEPGKPAVRVDLGGDKVSDADLAALESLPRLRRLYLGGAHITDAGLDHIRRLTELQKLYLADTPVTDAGLPRLKDLCRLQVLDLSRTRVTDAGLAQLEDMPRLQVLDLSHTATTGAGLAHLKKLDGLKELYLLGDKAEGDKGSEFEEKVLDFQKAQPQVKVVR
jgi:hypothetical protein